MRPMKNPYLILARAYVSCCDDASAGAVVVLAALMHLGKSRGFGPVGTSTALEIKSQRDRYRKALSSIQSLKERIPDPEQSLTALVEIAHEIAKEALR